MPLRARYAKLCTLLVCTAVAARAEKSRVLQLELLPIDPEVSRAVSRQISAALTTDFGDAFALVPEAQLEALRSGAVKPPDISAALAQLATGRDQLISGQYKAAQRTLKGVLDKLDPLRPKLRDYTPIANTLLYTAVAAMNLNDKKAAAAAFGRLARLRPDFRVDPAEFPPNVIEAFQKARQVEDKVPRGRLVVASTPAKAQVYLDELPVGVTPIAVPALAGEHVLRVALAEHVDFTQTVNVESYAKVEVQVPLEKDLSIEALRQLEAQALAGAPPGAFSEPATTVANALEADGIVFGVVALSVKGYLASVAYIGAGDVPQVMVVDLDRSLDKEKASLKKLAAAVVSAARGDARVTGVIGGGAPSRKVDFKKYELGVGPGGSAQVLADAAKARTLVGLAGGPPQAEKPPTRVWPWIVVGLAVAAAAGGGTAAYFVLRPPSGVQFELERQR